MYFGGRRELPRLPHRSEEPSIEQISVQPEVSALNTPLKAADRCDDCGAQAFFRVSLISGELLFCGHHGRKHEVALRAAGAKISDQTARLVAMEARRVRPSGAGWR